MIGVSTIGNATLIAYDEKPIISTDPWFGDTDPAYFGSWVTSHVFPKNLQQDVFNSEYIWLSHGHPDHINPISLEKLAGKKVLLPDHIGSRIYKGLIQKKYNVEVLPDRKWVQLSKNIKILCITTVIQDAILLIDIKGRLFVNLNDAGSRHCTNFIRKIVKGYSESYLLSLAGYGDADAIGFYDEDGVFVVPPAKDKIKVGEHLGIQAKSLGINNVIPFSSMHMYQRSDSVWANEYTTPINSYKAGLPREIKYIPPFINLNCSDGRYELINPDSVLLKVKNCQEFGDNWSDELQKSDRKTIDNYFIRKEKIRRDISFINFRVGGKENFFKFESSNKKGVTFEVPRFSLMKAINLEIFDDLLAGNFMKTTLHGMRGIYEGDFAFYLAKYADNGRAETISELEEYFKMYKQRAGREYLYQTFLDKSKDIFTRLISDDRGSFLYKKAKQIYYKLK
tara:strand:+ start:19 stop:1374 length:1356 start_codon:yes stop_codon:yes gene_type:complete